jgi:hypothetical protein
MNQITHDQLPAQPAVSPSVDRDVAVDCPRSILIVPVVFLRAATACAASARLDLSRYAHSSAWTGACFTQSREEVAFRWVVEKGEPCPTMII